MERSPSLDGFRSIEDLILARDQRGISAVRKYLPRGFCNEAARFVLEHRGAAIIVTGFCIADRQRGETDGPPGAIAMGNALTSLGYSVHYVSDGHNCQLLNGLVGGRAPVVDFPVTSHEESLAFARDLLGTVKPSLLIAIERVGFNRERTYRNRLGQDVSWLMAKTDYLFLEHPHSVGIGDGGNEIGMGLVEREVLEEGLPIVPATTSTTKLIVSGTSNWGGYGLVAALSLLSGRNLLPLVEEEKEWIRTLVRHGAVDSFTVGPTETVDGYSLEENAQVLEALHRLVDRGLKGLLGE